MAWILLWGERRREWQSSHCDPTGFRAATGQANHLVWGAAGLGDGRSAGRGGDHRPSVADPPGTGGLAVPWLASGRPGAPRSPPSRKAVHFVEA